MTPMGCCKDNTRKGLRKELTTYVEELIEAEQASLTTGASDVP